MHGRTRPTSRFSRAGFTLVELLLAVGIAAAIAASAVPLAWTALDDIRTGMAARYVESVVAEARLEAVSRAAAVGLRFERTAEDYRWRAYVDGNANGIRSSEIAAGTDALLQAERTLAQAVPGPRFGLRGGVPDVDGTRQPEDADGVRIGSSRILTLDPDGTATSGTLYIRGRRAQYAVRVLGATARTRMLRFDPGTRTWTAR